MTEDLLPAPAFRWSFSQWEAYEQCPQKWKFQSVLKLPRKPPGPAAARGLRIHKTVEDYIGGADASVLHEAIKEKYIPIFDAFRDHENGDRGVEKKLGMDADWAITAPSVKSASLIAVLDAYRFDNAGVLHIGEWKSGKPKDTHGDQRSLYAMIGHKAWKASETRVTTYYLEDTGPPQRLVLKSDSGMATLIARWSDRMKRMVTDQIRAPRPGYYCNWCDFSKSKGGPCQFS